MGSYFVTEKTYLIDTEKPQITVAYEKEKNGNFDCTQRKVQITISDSCLNVDSVQISIDTINGEQAEQSPWKISEKDGKKKCSCTMLFEREDTYTVKITGKRHGGQQRRKNRRTIYFR